MWYREWESWANRSWVLVAICPFTSDSPYSPKVFSVGLYISSRAGSCVVLRRRLLRRAGGEWKKEQHENDKRSMAWRKQKVMRSTSAGDSPWIGGRQSHWAGTCSHTAAAQHAPATLPQAGPGLYHRPHLLREGSASAGRSRSAGSSGTQRTTHGIATSSSASRSRAECSSTRQGGGETGSRPGVRGSQGKDGGPANKESRGRAAGPAQALQGTDKANIHPLVLVWLTESVRRGWR